MKIGWSFARREEFKKKSMGSESVAFVGLNDRMKSARDPHIKPQRAASERLSIERSRHHSLTLSTSSAITVMPITKFSFEVKLSVRLPSKRRTTGLLDCLPPVSFVRLTKGGEGGCVVLVVPVDFAARDSRDGEATAQRTSLLQAHDEGDQYWGERREGYRETRGI